MIKLPYAISFPWRFDFRSSFKLIPSPPPLSKVLSPHNTGFLSAFKSVTQAIADRDHFFLQKVLEPRLAKALNEGLDVIKRRNNDLKLVNESEYVTSYFYNERLYFGADIIRDKNSKNLQIKTLPEISEVFNWERDCRVPAHNVRVLHENISNLQAKIIFKVDVLYSSPVKLILFDHTGECVRGQTNYMPETHKFSFETAHAYPDSKWGIATSMIELVKFARANKSTLLENADWLITDIDSYLEGNPFVLTN